MKTKNTERVKCKICGWEGKNIGPHIDNKHTMNAKEYYDKYFKCDSEGFCCSCKKSTNFINIKRGYNKYCSKKCMHSSNDYKERQSVAHMHHEVTMETRNKISLSLMGHKLSKETIDKISCSKMGSRASIETREKMSSAAMGRVVPLKVRNKISKSRTGMKGTSPSLDTRKKLSSALMGKIVGEETRKKLRMALLKKIEENCKKYGKKFIHRSTKEIECVDGYLSLICPYKIDVDFRVCGYIVDGYIHELNLVLEFDEKYHNNFKQKIYDKERQKNIEEELGCNFFRIKESDWNGNRDKIISDFKHVCFVATDQK